MASAPLIIGERQAELLAALRKHAAAHPIDVIAVREQCKTPEGTAAHLKRMRGFSVHIPSVFVVSFSVEVGHPAGTCRHLSVSSTRRGKTPTPEAVHIIAEELGFAGGLDSCFLWEEAIGGGDVAINVVQPIRVASDGGDRVS